MKKTEDVKRDMARAMVETGLTYREVAEKLNIGLGTVHSVIAEKLDDSTQLKVSVRKKFGRRCLMMADQILEGIKLYNIVSAPLQQQIKSIAILLEMAAMLEKGAEHTASEQNPEKLAETSEHPNMEAEEN